MNIVKQYNDHACVTACLESIKVDWGDSTFSHEDFVSANLPDFCEGTKIEGSCRHDRIEEVFSKCGLEAKKTNLSGPTAASPDVAYVAYVHMENSPNHMHFVRFDSYDGNTINAMDPQAAKIRRIPASWIQDVYKVTKKAI